MKQVLGFKKRTQLAVIGLGLALVFLAFMMIRPQTAGGNTGLMKVDNFSRQYQPLATPTSDTGSERDVRRSNATPNQDGSVQGEQTTAVPPAPSTPATPGLATPQPTPTPVITPLPTTKPLPTPIRCGTCPKLPLSAQSQANYVACPQVYCPQPINQ